MNISPKETHKQPKSTKKVVQCYQSLQSKTTMGYHLIRYMTVHIGEDVEKLESLYTVGGKIKWFNCFGKQIHSSSKC